MTTTTIFPGRYVQGENALSLLSEEAARLGAKGFAIVDPAVRSICEQAVAEGAGFPFVLESFRGECSDEEIARLTGIAKAGGADVIVGMGGGKSLDAPCSALSVIYTAEGAFKRYLVLPRNPDVVLVDSTVILNAPLRFLVSGMGDALSTWFEAEDCRISGAANMTGRPGGMTAFGLARMCLDTLMDDGPAAVEAMQAKKMTPALERVIEANTLLSGLGFESGGLSGAHAIHNGLTVLPGAHGFWHGEKVAIGTLALIALTARPADLVARVYDFCLKVGLPVCLEDIGLTDPTDDDLMQVARMACAPGETIHNIKGDVTPEQVLAAIKAADAEGRRRKAA
jgi:glycerol dehydrogenase